jgi:uncharacterized protein (TIGR03435 family)
MPRVLVALLLIFPLTYGATQRSPSLIMPGDVAPPVTLKAVLQSPSTSIPDWNTLKGKVVVLEFWATWCGPCVEAIPHLNELVEHFKGKPIEFINVTAEDEAHVAEFLKFRHMSGLIGLDPDKSMIDAYGAHLIPRIVVVGKDGIVKAVTEPEYLDTKALEMFLAGETPKLPTDIPTEPNAPGSTTRKPALFEAEIRPSGTPVLEDHKTASLEADGWPLKLIVAMAYEIPDTRIISATPFPDSRYEFRVAVPTERQEELHATLRQALATALNVKAHWETREMDVLILKAPEHGLGPFLRLTDKRAPEKVARGSVSCQGITMNHFAEMLEGDLDQIVIDQTGMQGYYDVALYWDPDKPDSVRNSIAEELGLSLVPARRELKVLVMDHFDVPAGRK